MNRLSFVMMCALISLSMANLPQSGCEQNLDEVTCVTDQSCKWIGGVSPNVYNRCISKNVFGFDMVFVMDCGGSISESDWNIEKQFVTESIKLLNGGASASQFSIVTFNQSSYLQYGLSTGYQSAIDNVDSLSYYPWTGSHAKNKFTLNGVRKGLNSLLNGNNNNVKIMILLTDNVPDGPDTACSNGVQDLNGVCGPCNGNRISDGLITMSSRISNENVNVITVYFKSQNNYNEALTDCLRNNINMEVKLTNTEMNNLNNELNSKVASFVDALSIYGNGVARRLFKLFGEYM